MSVLSPLTDNPLLISTLLISALLGCYGLKQAIMQHGYLKKIVYSCVFFLSLMSIGIATDAWHDKTLPVTQKKIVMTNTQGQQVDIKALSQHQPVTLYFWGSWCNSCRLVTPSVRWLSHQYPTIGIAVMSGDNEHMRQYLDSHRPDYWIVNDPNKRISHQWQVSKAPTILIIYKNKVRFVTQGLVSPIGL